MEAIWARIEHLTPRQREIVGLVEDGLFRTDSLATRLGARPETVRNHLNAIYGTMRVLNMHQLAIAMYWKKLAESSKPILPPENFLATILSCREREVGYLIAQGYGNLNISATLNISEHTTKRHLSNIFCKLEVSNRIELAFLILREKFVFQQCRRSPVPP